MFDRQVIALDNWVENDFVGENPTDRIISNFPEQALYNVYHEVCIGDTIYQCRPEAVLLIPVEYIDNINKVRKCCIEDMPPYVKVVVQRNHEFEIQQLNGMPLPCLFDFGEHTISSDQKIIWTVSSYMKPIPFNRAKVQVTSSIKNYVKVNNK